MGLKICVSTCVKNKKAVYVVSISAGNKERNTLVIKIIVINDNNNNNNNTNNNNNNFCAYFNKNKIFITKPQLKSYLQSTCYYKRSN